MLLNTPPFLQLLLVKGHLPTPVMPAYELKTKMCFQIMGLQIMVCRPEMDPPMIILSTSRFSEKSKLMSVYFSLPMKQLV